MRTYIVLFAIISCCGLSVGAQTRLWTYNVTAPTAFTSDGSTVLRAHSSVSGDLCVVIRYTNGSSAVGSLLLWLDNTGSLIYSDVIVSDDDNDFPQPWRVSNKDLLVAFGISHPAIADRLRRYHRERGMVTVTDTTLAIGEFLPSESDTDTYEDVEGFVVYGSDPLSAATITSISRFSVK